MMCLYIFIKLKNFISDGDIVFTVPTTLQY